MEWSGAKELAKCTGTRPDRRLNVVDCPLKLDCWRYMTRSDCGDGWMIPLPDNDLSYCEWMILWEGGP